MAKKLKAPVPNPSANEDMMPKGMGEEARKMLEQGRKEAKQPTKISDVEGYARGGGVERVEEPAAPVAAGAVPTSR